MAMPRNMAKRSELIESRKARLDPARAARERDVLGTRPRPGHELEPDVEPPAPRAVFADPDAADEGVDGRGHVVDGDPDLRAPGPVGGHPQLGHADAGVRVAVGD